jgi:glutamyl-tRNA reductase
MALSDLIVVNHRKAAKADALAPGLPEVEGCVVRTCLREVQVTTRAYLNGAAAHIPHTDANGASTVLYQGAEAYGFLLRLATGLESEIVGETEIFGQIKQAWRDFETNDGARPLRPWMQRLLQETKEIRSEYVVGLGSATYGSLTRRLLGGRPEGTTLLLGAGQLAATILPYLDGTDLLIHNRNPARAFAMLAEARERQGGSVTVLDPGLEAELAAWREARDIILCVPADAERDIARAKVWRDHGAARGGRLLHLGIRGTEGTAFDGLPNVATLDEMFSLRDSQAGQRTALLNRARKACIDKAQLARLDDADGSRSGSSNHGWEDLAVFQAQVAW